MLRAFIALDLPDGIRHYLRTISATMQERLAGMPIGWMPVENIHLTLKFLGNISEQNADNIGRILDDLAPKFSPLELSVGGVGAFPNPKRARVLWVGVAAAEALLDLQQEIERGCQSLGYPAERRPFSAHLTLGRVQRDASHKEVQQIARGLQTQDFDRRERVFVDELALFRSELSPEGAVYSALHSVKFTQPT